jgi:hypothetical protein
VIASETVLVGAVVAVAVFLLRVGLADKAEVRELRDRVDALEDTLESLREDVEALALPDSLQDEFYVPGEYRPRAEAEGEET